MARSKINNGPDLIGWAIAAAAAVVAFGLCVLVGKLGVTSAAALAAVVFVVVGVILGMPKRGGPDVAAAAVPEDAALGSLVVPAPIPASAADPAPEPATPAPAIAPVTPAPEAAAVVAAAAPSSGFVAMVPETAPIQDDGPQRLTAARGGVADNLKEIEGIGPAMEAMCNGLGFYHFDQIANWSDADMVWVDENMGRFKGRATRDKWVAQARLIVAEGVDAFRIRAKTNDY